MEKKKKTENDAQCTLPSPTQPALLSLLPLPPPQFLPLVCHFSTFEGNQRAPTLRDLPQLPSPAPQSIVIPPQLTPRHPPPRHSSASPSFPRWVSQPFPKPLHHEITYDFCRKSNCPVTLFCSTVYVWTKFRRFVLACRSKLDVKIIFQYLLNNVEGKTKK